MTSTIIQAGTPVWITSGELIAHHKLLYKKAVVVRSYSQGPVHYVLREVDSNTVIPDIWTAPFVFATEIEARREGNKIAIHLIEKKQQEVKEYIDGIFGVIVAAN